MTYAALRPAALAILMAGVASAPPAQGTLPPPPPPTIYDPIPGPYIIHLDAGGQMLPDQEGIIANAIAQWSGDRLQAFSICYRWPDGRVDWTKLSDAMTSIAQALKRHGARAVFAPNGRECGTTFRSTIRGGPHVEIMGVVQL